MQNRTIDFLIGTVALLAFLLLLIENTAIGDANPELFSQLNLAILLIFAADVLARLALATNRRAHLRRKWFDLVVFVPLVQFWPGVRDYELFVVLRQLVLVTVLISRSQRAGKLLSLVSLRPAQALATGFLGAIGIGTVLLMMPLATADGMRTPFVDALFTATSATCVTGLIVHDTATHFSRFGQLVILVLIQAGGLGIMTFSVSLAAILRKSMDIRQQATLRDALDHDALAGVRSMIRFIIMMTFSAELIGALALFVCWRNRLASQPTALFHAVFHSVSAFCNAGFSTFSDSLAGFRGDLATNAVVSSLVITGGIGFLVVRDIASRVHQPKRRRAIRLRLQTRTVLTASIVLIAGGAICFYGLERGGTLSDLPAGERWIAAVFQSVTARTAGFNTVDLANLSSGTLLVMMVLMFVGGSPGSTAGGIKTTTAAVIIAAVADSLRGQDKTDLWRRTIPADVVNKALSVLAVSAGTVTLFSILLLHLEQKPMRDVMFEVVSAFGTVGLSTGLTPSLSTAGRVAVTLLMFIGRLGPITIAFALMRRRVPARHEYAEERMMIG